jgi:hypothetical protein
VAWRRGSSRSVKRWLSALPFLLVGIACLRMRVAKHRAAKDGVRRNSAVMFDSTSDNE